MEVTDDVSKDNADEKVILRQDGPKLENRAWINMDTINSNDRRYTSYIERTYISFSCDSQNE